MINLIFLFYAMLFSINAPVQPDCENKLKELNYTYEYNQEPAHMPNLRGRDRYSRHKNINDTIPRSVKLEVKSMYNCFKLALDADTNKVLFVIYNPSANQKSNNEKVKDQSSYRNYFNANRIIHYHNLKSYKIYSKISQDKKYKSKYQVELLDKTDSKLKAEKVRLWEECKNCPF